MAQHLSIRMLPCRGDSEFTKEVFEPLGYTVEYKTHILDEFFPEWGESAYIDLTLTGKVTLSALLNHLYVLIPVFDKQKHYWECSEEVDKLMKHGEGWLANHPIRNRIINRYFSSRKSLAHRAIDQLIESDSEEMLETADQELENENACPDPYKEKRITLNTRRLDAVHTAVLESGAVTVIDLGCGEGKLTSMLLEDKQIKKVTAADVSIQVLDRFKKNLHFERMQPYKKQKLELIQASLTYKDLRFSGFDAACVVEVIEHLDPQRISAFERVVFEFASPRTVIVTTPNQEYNTHYEMMRENGFRHNDHRFEWTRGEFESWTKHICEKFGYTVVQSEIGDIDEQYGSPTQMGVFTTCV